MLQLNSNNNNNDINFDLNIYHNLKTVELIRGRYGYGFDLKGDRPSIIGSIRKNSPADLNGLKEGDLVIAINNTKVTDLDHDQVVRLIGQSKTNLVLQVTKVLKNAPSVTNNYDILYDITAQQPRLTNKKTKLISYANSNYDYYLDVKQDQQALYDDDYDDDEEEDFYDDKNNNVDESVDSSEDDCSMQPFYAHKLKPFTNISNISNKKKYKSKTSLDYAFLNQQPKATTTTTSRISLVQSASTHLNVNDLYAILSPLIKPFVYNQQSMSKYMDTSYIFNCNYIGTVHIPYDTLNNALKLNSIRSSIEYFLTQKREEKTVCLSIYRDNLMIKETANNQQFMCFNSTQIGFCGKIKQLNDFFAIIIMSLDKLTSSSCLLFRLSASEIQKLDLILNLISKIYRNQNYVFNNPPIVSTQPDIITTLNDTTILSTNLNKKHFSSKLNDINENDELCLSKGFQRNSENTQSIKIIKENLTNLFLSKFNNQTEQQKKSLSLPHNYNLLQVKQDLIVPIKDEKEKQMPKPFLSTQKLKSKFKKSTFQFLKSKPPIVVSSSSKALAASGSINNLFNTQQQQQQLDCQRRRLSDYHRPSLKVSLKLLLIDYVSEIYLFDCLKSIIN